MIDINKPNEFGLITKKEISAFEKLIGFNLPENYSAFLRLNNGGQPKLDTLKVRIGKTEELWSINYFYGLHSKEDWASMFVVLNSLKSRIPNEFIPIANDSGGNYYVLNLSKEKYGQISFWNHNNESENKGINYYKNITFLFKSFSELASSLTIDNNDIEVKIIETDDEFIIE